jgi:hypothetical protein
VSTLPSAPAQIHVPNVASTRAQRLRAAHHAARGALGLVLVVGAPAAVLLTWTAQGEVVTAAAIPAVWLAALASATVAHVLTMSRACVDVTEGATQRALLFAGIALVGPLTLHLALQAHAWAPRCWLMWAGPFDVGEPTFAGWMHASLPLAGPSHLVFAPLCALRGYRSARGQRGPQLGLVGVAAALPALWCFVYGILLGALPVAYVALTSVPLLLLMRHLERADGRTQAKRTVLSSLPGSVR